jgi:hypothetical protein
MIGQRAHVARAVMIHPPNIPLQTHSHSVHMNVWSDNKVITKLLTSTFDWGHTPAGFDSKVQIWWEASIPVIPNICGDSFRGLYLQSHNFI